MPVPVGANVTTTVQVADELIVVVQVPPVPGNVPPLYVYGAAKPDGAIAVAATPPEFVTVNVLSVVDVVAWVP